MYILFNGGMIVYSIAILPIQDVDWITNRDWLWVVWLVIFVIIVIYNKYYFK